MALRYHLRADEHIDAAFGEIKKLLFQLAFPRDRITVDPFDLELREFFFELIGNVLGAFADEI